MNRRIILFFLFTISFNIFSIELIEINDKTSSMSLGPNMELLPDQTAELELNDVLKPEYDKLFYKSNKNTPSFGFTKTAVWGRFSIKPVVFQHHNWYIQFAMPLLDYLDYYLFKDGKLVKEIHTGYLRAFNTREFENRKFVFPLDLSDNKTITVYMRFASGDRVEIPLKLLNEKDFEKDDHIGDFFIGIFYGICFALLLNNTFLYFSTKDKGLLKYLFVIIFLVLFQATEDGLIHKYFWPFETPFLKHYVLILNSSIIIATIEFTKEYLNTKALNKIMHYVLIAFASLLTLNIFSRVVFDYYITTRNLTFLAAGGMTACLATSVILMKKNFRPSLFYFVAFSESLMGGMVFTLKAAAVIPTNIFTTYSIQLGTSVTIVLLGMALGDKINVTKKLAADAQKAAIDNLNNLNNLKDKFVNQLEQEVENRTIELKKEKDRADKANQAKSDFLANMSHEMRTPLNCIIGFGEFIVDNEKMKTHKKYASLIINESERLLELINQLLDITKIESGKLKLDKYDSNLYKIIQNIITSLGIRAENKDIKLISNIDKEIPKRLHLDALRIRQILINLIGNGIKFTDTGSVTLNIKLLKTNKETVNMRFEIMDTGIGIPKSRQKSIFNSFEQADPETTRKYGGTGLGTTISKDLLELMGGKLKLESEVGKGSRFWFDLEIERAKGLKQEPRIYDTGTIKRKDLPKTRVLIAEDYPPNREVLDIHLSDSPISFEFAKNGEIALEKASNDNFDIILMDIRMPVMDGIEATKEIRKLETAKNTKIIGLTANAFPEDIKLYLETGMNDVIVKPVRKKILYSKIIEWHKKSADEKTSEKDLYLDMNKLKHKNEIIHINEFIEEMDNDKKKSIKMILTFLDNIEEDLKKINTAIIKKNSKEVHRISHSIKGGAMNIMAPKLEKAAKALEVKAKKEDLSDAPNLHRQIHEEYKTLKDYINLNF